MCRSLKCLKTRVQEDYSGCEVSLVPIRDVPEEDARALLKKLPTYGDDFVEEAIRMGTSETGKNTIH